MNSILQFAFHWPQSQLEKSCGILITNRIITGELSGLSSPIDTLKPKASEEAFSNGDFSVERLQGSRWSVKFEVISEKFNIRKHSGTFAGPAASGCCQRTIGTVGWSESYH